MKKIVSILVLAWGLSAVAGVEGGGGATGVGGGGDAYALEFTAMGRGALGYVRAYADQFPEIASEELAKAIDATQVTSIDHAYLEDARGRREVDAINYPDVKKIELSRTRWAQLDTDARITLVLHEYLGILRLADEGFLVSGRLLGLIKNRPANSSQQLECRVQVRETVTNEERTWTRWSSLTGMPATSQYFDANGLPRVLGEQQGSLRVRVVFAGSPLVADVVVYVAESPELISMPQVDGTVKWVPWYMEEKSLLLRGTFDLSRTFTAQAAIHREFVSGKVKFVQDLARLQCVLK
ncbi:MAG: hypothetical protein AB7P04_09940 [Bacteriovoracia bacterium]